jgi:membrane associated rhomboid family serine protease
MAPSAPPPPSLPPDSHEPTGPEEAVEEPRGMTVDEMLRQITPRAWVTPAMAILIVIGFVVELALGVSLTGPTGAQLLKAGGQFGPSFAGGEWWRSVTSMFLHSGPIHLAFNLWAFWSIGRLTERIYGSRSFLAIYLLSGIGASLTSVAWKKTGFSVTCGASSWVMRWRARVVRSSSVESVASRSARNETKLSDALT